MKTRRDWMELLAWSLIPVGVVIEVAAIVGWLT